MSGSGKSGTIFLSALGPDPGGPDPGGTEPGGTVPGVSELGPRFEGGSAGEWLISPS